MKGPPACSVALNLELWILKDTKLMQLAFFSAARHAGGPFITPVTRVVVEGPPALALAP